METTWTRPKESSLWMWCKKPFVVVTTYGILLQIEGAEQPLPEESTKSGIANMADDAMKHESAMVSR